MATLLRVATAGSVDDGKSTLIGRLLHDSNSLFIDQLAAIERTSRARGWDTVDLALITDGLRAEREQGITIDVAYRYFTTPRRKFILADTPGHLQYTRNMVTGASTADLALVLIDARHGVREQTRRHAFLSSLLGIRHLVVCVNKMDLVEFSQARFEEIQEDFRRFATKLDVPDVAFIPVSALLGDNIVLRGNKMDWYKGSSLLHHLEEVTVSSEQNLVDVRLPVQFVIRYPHQDSTETGDNRGYAGTMAGGVLKRGDKVVVLPSGGNSTVSAIWGPGGRPLEEAYPPTAVAVELADKVDVARGDLICRLANRPFVRQEIYATVCWMDEASPLRLGSRYRLHHTTRATWSTVAAVEYRLDVNTLHRDWGATELAFNEIGRVRLRTQQPLTFDPYQHNRATGSFILVDEITKNTVGAGMIIDASHSGRADVRYRGPIARVERPTGGASVWLTGLSGSGKSSVALELERLLVAVGRRVYVLDGDNLRRGLNADLGFSPPDRAENVRRVGEVAKLMADIGVVAVVSLISPYRKGRDAVRAVHEADETPFMEVFVNTPLEICEQRDPKGLYARARAGEIADFTGVNSPYEEPRSPEVLLRPDDGTAAAMAATVAAVVEDLLSRRSL